MDKILKNHQIPSSIIDLIESSKEYCFLVTPYFKSWPLLTRALERASKNGQNIVFIFRFLPEIAHMKELNKLYDFDVIFIENMHSKLYLNEKSVIISSMNLYDASKENNYETGYLIDNKRTAKEFYENIIKGDLLSLKPSLAFKGRYSKLLIKLKEEEELKKAEKEKRLNNNKGFCIRCRKTIFYDPYTSLCQECYSIWQIFSNNDYIERYCHKCGIEHATTKIKPLCSKCGF